MFKFSYLLVISVLKFVTSLVIDLMIFTTKVSMRAVNLIAKLTHWLISWRNRNIEALLLREKLCKAKSYSEWLKTAKSYDKLAGTRR